MRAFRMMLVSGSAAVSLVGCSLGDDLQALINSGGEKNEYRAVRNQPLVVPPGFDLRPPVGGGGATRQARSTTVRARRVVVGGAAVGSNVPAGTGERSLIRNASRGVGGVNKFVRQEVNKETKDNIVREQRFTDKLLKWEKRKGGEVRKNPLGGKVDPIIKREGEIF
ncbi:MAG: DUF3035 domain-containing protein [Alphaproteobacteria bacterium]|nr:DUF3035 domain-containing protein [Alphaproteobacteria bacterium]